MAYINVFDQNEPPVAKDMTFSNIPEHSHVSVDGLNIGTPIPASDPDGDILRYNIIDGNTGDAFSIHIFSGQIYVANAEALDFEIRQNWVLTVEVSDSGNGNLTDVCEVRIEIYDVNEFPIV